ncbi:hypothetical protein TevJSym_ab00580 [endosymbiont of Tevnia jerichonana (vent Tica)]|uniref:Uncharacterized protein n=1 Tax=endosymbiont of Tevnia jerichonana (vent Tica) TaxID=1049564 RepID=G2FBM5_9GAMM|nr:hypothetical protein TevJSym_ab00580 [endosymbiont of Tevnia jerichonana (vent Tica)]
MRANRQRQGNVSDSVANVIKIGAEAAPDIQFAGQNAIEVVHDIIEDD